MLNKFLLVYVGNYWMLKEILGVFAQKIVALKDFVEEDIYNKLFTKKRFLNLNKPNRMVREGV